MTDYTKFDAALLARIRQRPASFSELLGSGTLRRVAEALGVTNSFGHAVDTYRVFDRRLQALRRAGKIRYTGKVWEVHDDR